MANFNCSICGGQISMQANRGGVCKECGMEYDLDAIRTMLSPNHSVSTVPSAATQTSNSSVEPPRVASPPAPQSADTTADRQLLISCLTDARLMETIIHESRQEIARIESEYAKFGEAIAALENNPSEEPTKQIAGLHYQKDEAKRKYSSAVNSIWIAGFIVGVCVFFYINIIGMEWDFDPVYLACLGAAASLVVAFLCHRKRQATYLETEEKLEFAIQTTLSRYKAMCEKHEDAIKQVRRHQFDFRKKADEEIKAINTDIEDTQVILDKCYSINLIPSQFRNIRGIYYLYDYITTSNQSLSEALMQYNLDTMAKKLDNIIENQCTQIIQQAQANAELEFMNDTLDLIYEVSEDALSTSVENLKVNQQIKVHAMVSNLLADRQLAYQKQQLKYEQKIYHSI